MTSYKGKGVGLGGLMTIDDEGEGGVKNDQKHDDVIYGRPHTRYEFISQAYSALITHAQLHTVVAVLARIF